MMENVQIVCPECGVAFGVSTFDIGKKGRCNHCGDVFVIQPGVQKESPEHDINEDTVFDWLCQDLGAGVGIASPSRGKAKSRATAKSAVAGKSAKGAAGTQDQGDQLYPVRLDHIDDMGAFFVFDSRLLNDTNFRYSFPRCCILCGDKKHLSVYLVFWSSKLGSVARLPAEAGQSQVAMELDNHAELQGAEFLDVLGQAQNVPEPYCLPFPYYICHNCSPVGAMITDVHRAINGSGERCEVGIHALEQAEQFAAAVCGEETEAVARIRRVRREQAGDLWLTLPIAVRNRIGQWFKAEEGEKVVAYIPDADFSRAEAGTAGVLVTDRRLVYRKSIAVIEMPRNQDITIQPVSDDGKRKKIKLLCPGCKPAALSLHQTSLDKLTMLLHERSGSGAVRR